MIEQKECSRAGVPLWAAAMLVLATAQATAQEAGSVERIERGNLVIEGVPAIPPSVSERLQQYENTRSAYFAGFTGDGGILIATRFAETEQIHKVDAPMGMRRQLTRSCKRCWTYRERAAPEGARHRQSRTGRK